MKIVAVCGSGLGSSFIVEMNIQQVCKEIGLDAEVSHTNIGSFDPLNTDLLVCGEDLSDTLVFENKIVLKNLIDKEETKTKLLKFIEGNK